MFNEREESMTLADTWKLIRLLQLLLFIMFLTNTVNKEEIPEGQYLGKKVVLNIMVSGE